MADASATSTTASEPRDYELLAQQRHRAQARVARERANNTRLGIFAAAIFVGILAIAIRAGWEPLRMVSRQPSPADERAREFAATRTANILLKTGNPDICREVQFHNDDGTFTRGRNVRCDDAVTASTGTVVPSGPDRITSVRDWFNGK
jgi:hypothetical protein